MILYFLMMTAGTVPKPIGKIFLAVCVIPATQHTVLLWNRMIPFVKCLRGWEHPAAPSHTLTASSPPGEFPYRFYRETLEGLGMSLIKAAWDRARLDYQCRYYKKCRELASADRSGGADRGAMLEMSYVLHTIFGLTDSQVEEVGHHGFIHGDLTGQ